MRKNHAVAAVLLVSTGLLTLGCHPVSQDEFDALGQKVDALEQVVKLHRDTSLEWAIKVTATLNWLYTCQDPGPCPGPGVTPPPPPALPDW